MPEAMADAEEWPQKISVCLMKKTKWSRPYMVKVKVASWFTDEQIEQAIQWALKQSVPVLAHKIKIERKVKP